MSEYRGELIKQFPLGGVGTRWEHYSEIRELFAVGIAVIEGLEPSYRKSFTEKLVKLKGALELMDARLNLLSGFDEANRFSSPMAVTLRSIDLQRTKGTLEGFTPYVDSQRKLLTEGSNATQEKAVNNGSPAKDSEGEADDSVSV